jgi:ankyrin repeat protein
MTLRQVVCLFLCVVVSNTTFSDIAGDLSDSVRAHDFVSAETLLKNGAPVNGDTWETSPLYTALENNDLRMSMLLLYYKADLARVLDIPYRGRMSLLEYALEYCDEKFTRVCKEVSGRAELDKKLIAAIGEHDYTAAEALLKAGAGTDTVFMASIGDFPAMIRDAADTAGMDAGPDVPETAGADKIIIRTAFDYALALGDEKMVRLLLERQAADRPLFDERTLYLAVRCGNLNIIRLVLQNGKYAKPPLDAAAAAGDPAVINLLLANGADPDRRYLNGHSAADIAVKYGHAGAALLLLLRETATGTDLKEMYKAIYDNDVAHVRRLVASGFDLNSGWFTPLAWAAYLGRAKLVDLLPAAGADVHDAAKPEDASPVFLAVLGGHADITRLLLDRGAPVDACDEYGWTLLHQAVEDGRTDLVDLLLERGADREAYAVRGVYAHTFCPAGTPFALAAALGDVEILRIFIKHKTPLYKTGSGGRTPLHFAALYGRARAVGYLCDQGADINAEDSNGDAPLHLAAQNGDPEMIAYLIGRGARIGETDARGVTPLFYALEYGQLAAAKLLINRGASLKKAVAAGAGANGLTLLHLAARAGYVDITEFLLARGADPNTTDKDGVSPLCLAVYYDHLEIARLLVKYGAALNLRCGRLPDWDFSASKNPAVLDLASSLEMWSLLYEAGARPSSIAPSAF